MTMCDKGVNRTIDPPLPPLRPRKGQATQSCSWRAHIIIRSLHKSKIHIHMEQETDEEVRALLGGWTVAQFGRLPADKRKAIYRRHLVQDELVMIDDCEDEDFANPQISEEVRLRQQYFMGDDDIGKKLVKEATETYYGENEFYVRLYWLREFLVNTSPISIPGNTLRRWYMGLSSLRLP